MAMDKYEMQDFIGEMIISKFEKKVEDVSGESNDATGRCDVVVTFINGQQMTISIREDGE